MLRSCVLLLHPVKPHQPVQHRRIMLRSCVLLLRPPLHPVKPRHSLDGEEAVHARPVALERLPENQQRRSELPRVHSQGGSGRASVTGIPYACSVLASKCLCT